MKAFKRIFTALTSILLAVLMSLLTPVQCIGAENEIVYISDIEFAYGNGGISQLEDAGYTVWKDLNANDGGNGESVWIGYKTTTNVKEAITDIAMMNMEGGYSFTDWENEFKAINNNVTAMQKEFIRAVKEFRDNYKKGSEYAKVAYRLLNLFKEDDSGKKVGDLFLDENITEDVLHKILLEGNTDNLEIIEKSLAVGLVENKGENMISRLAKTSYDDELDVSANHDRTVLLKTVESFRYTIEDALKIAKTADEYDGGVEAYLDSLGSDAAAAVSQIELIRIAKEIRLGDMRIVEDGIDRPMTLYDMAMLKTGEELEDGEHEPELMLDMHIIEMLRKSLTSGQLGVINAVGLSTVILNAYATAEERTGFVVCGLSYDDDNGVTYEYTGTDSGNNILDTLKSELQYWEKLETVSVYYGVDREVFRNYSDVAMTSTAIRERALSGDTTLGRGKVEISTSYDAKVVLSAAIVAGASAAIGIGCFVGSYVLYKNPVPLSQGRTFSQIVSIEGGGVSKYIDVTGQINEIGDSGKIILQYQNEYPNSTVRLSANRTDIIKKPDGTFETYAQRSMTNTRLAMNIVGFITVAVMLTCLLCILIEQAIKPKDSDYVYTAIPRVLVDMSVDTYGRKSYTYYHAVKLPKFLHNGKNSIDLYGDVNAINKKDQWYVMYFTKDRTAGTPLTPDIMVRSDTSLSASEKNAYMAVHNFGDTAAADMNYYNSSSRCKNVYIYFKTAPSSTATGSLSGSLFNLENGIICLSSVIVGGLAAFVITYLVMKKKKNTVTE